MWRVDQRKPGCWVLINSMRAEGGPEALKPALSAQEISPTIQIQWKKKNEVQHVKVDLMRHMNSYAFIWIPVSDSMKDLFPH